MGKLHTVSVSVGLQTSTCKEGRKEASLIKSVQAQQGVSSNGYRSDHSPTLKVFPTYKAGIDVDVGERDGAEFLKVKVQHTPGG